MLTPHQAQPFCTTQHVLHTCTFAQHMRYLALQDFAKLPWEVSMSKEDAAKTLGSYLGISALEPAAVLNLDRDQVGGVRRALPEGYAQGHVAWIWMPRCAVLGMGRETLCMWTSTLTIPTES